MENYLKLCGNIILRIRDFRDYFNMDDFYKNLSRFAKIPANSFCDTEEERSLFKLTSNWAKWVINQDVPFQPEHEGVTIQENMLIINDSQFHLGNIEKLNSRFNDSISSRNRIGLTALYLLIYGENYNGNTGDMREGYEKFISTINNGEVVDVSPYLYLEEDTVYGCNYDDYGPFKMKYIINRSNNNIRVTAGNNSVQLEPHEGTTAIFKGNQCRHLYQNRGNVRINGQTVEIRFLVKDNGNQGNHSIPTLEVDGQQIAENVYCFVLDDYNNYMYLDNEGIKNPSDNYRMQLFINNIDNIQTEHPVGLIALPNGEFKVITENSII